jgi:hypothetical protein
MSFHFLFIPFDGSDNKSGFLVWGKGPCNSSDLFEAINANRIETLSICEMHSHADNYRSVGECSSLAVADNSNITVTAIIHKPNTITKIQEGVLNGFSIKFDLEQHRIVEIALIDAPTFQDDEDNNVQEEAELARDIYREIDRVTSLDELERHLESFLNKEIRSGRLEKVRVDRVADLRIEIHIDEHPPPHFHVSGDGIDASFSIEDGSPLTGNLKPVHARRVRSWYKHSRSKLIDIWNKTRPGDCSVGPIS